MAGDESEQRSRHGERLQRALTPAGPDERPDAVQLTRLRALGVDVAALGATLARWYESQGMAAEVLPDRDRTVVQARSKTMLQSAIVPIALTITLRHEGADLLVEIGGEQWHRESVRWYRKSPLGVLAEKDLARRSMQFIAATLPNHLAPAVREPRQPAPPPQPIEVNSATADQLTRVPGLPVEVAAQILARRDAAGPYSSWEDLAVRLADCAPPALMAAVHPWLAVSAAPPPPPPSGTHPGFRRPQRGPQG